MSLTTTDNIRKLSKYFNKVIEVIDLSIKEKRPIIISHHNDADGIMGGYIMEQALTKYITQYNFNNRDNKYKGHIKRFPSPPPYYDTKDALNHIVQLQREIEQFKKIGACVIVIDNGCSSQDLPALKRMKALNYYIIVIDHHFPGIIEDGKFPIDHIADAHVSSHYPKDEIDTKSISAGILAAEIAFMLMPSLKDIAYLCGTVSLFGDGCVYEEFEQCMKNIEKMNYTKEIIEKITFTINYEFGKLRYNFATHFLEFLLLLKDREKGLKYIDIVFNEGQELMKYHLESSKNNCNITKFDNNITFIEIDAENYIPRVPYPPVGKVVSHLHWDHYEQDNNSEIPLITIGFLADAIIFRANNAPIGLNEIIEKLKEEFPFAHIDGGGHYGAGTIRFIKGYKQNIVKYFKNIIENYNI